MKKHIAALAVAAIISLGAGSIRAEGPAIGSKAPDFSLVDTNGKTRALSEFKGKTVVLEWLNFGCPFVRKHYDSGNMQSLQKKWTGKGVVWLSICSSAPGKEGNMAPAEWNKQLAEEKSAATAVLLDESGSVGKSYDAKTTPHMFVISPDGTLIYKGAIDDKPSYKTVDVKGAKNYVDAALEESMAAKKVTVSSTESYGCSVKYAK